MFFDTQVMAIAAKAAEQWIGKMGRYANVADDKYLSVSLYTHQAGKFWYGDINFPAERKQVQGLAQALKETVYILPESDGTDRRPFFKQAIAQVTP